MERIGNIKAVEQLPISTNNQNKINNRVETINNAESTLSNLKTSDQVPSPKNEIDVDSKPKVAVIDPEDWSDELSAIDSEIRRLDWSRIDESNYLNRSFGYRSRLQITQYSQLVSYLDQLKKLENGKLPDQAELPLQRNELINESNRILKDLDWDLSESRRYLQEIMKVSSRQELSDKQLSRFNNALAEELERRKTNSKK